MLFPAVCCQYLLSFLHADVCTAMPAAMSAKAAKSTAFVLAHSAMDLSINSARPAMISAKARNFMYFFM